MTYRDTLNKMKWDDKNLSEAVIYVKHRGAENDMKKIRGFCISSITSKGFYYIDNEEVFIPFHRVIKIEKETSGEQNGHLERRTCHS
jgi:uncharacterized protein (UPF0248 family)